MSNKKKKSNNMEEGQRGKDAKENNEENKQQKKLTGQEKNSVNTFEALTKVKEENYVKIVKEQGKKQTETSQPWVKFSFGKTQVEVEKIQTILECSSTNKHVRKENNEEYNMLNQPISNKDKVAEQSNTNTNQHPEIPKHDENKEKKINSNRNRVEEENLNNNLVIKAVENEVNKLGVAEKEQENEKWRELAHKESINDTQSSSDGDKGVTIDQQGGVTRQGTQSEEVIGENMNDHIVNNTEDNMTKEDDMQRKCYQLIAKNFKQRGQ
ncbi:hypothetical protein K7X08_030892 [Anisodus acutangulus]|uniref:Uncharacterized protein n=1 Tax=Anisodus acutangulus TaxID=402998 RepID=A0A9Q1RBF1_9SOLA|nr:hypothetical protein K7X08_030892 [Anisodus acutangulus]